MGTGILSSLGRLSSFGGSCFGACAARVTVVCVCVCVCVCTCVCLLTNITYGASLRAENTVTCSAGKEDKGICLKQLHSRVMQRNSQHAKYSNLPAVSFLRLTDSEMP